MSKTTKKIIIVILIIFIIGIAFYFLVFSKKQEMPIITPTPILTSTSTPIPFPISLEDFRQEIKNNCAFPPEEVEPINPFPDIPFQSYPEDVKFRLMREGMLSWLKNEVKKEVGIDEITTLGIAPYVESNDDNWYCVGIVLVPSLAETQTRNFESDWGKWDYPTTLIYWSEKGLVIYEYQPPTPTL
jgi:hypothetical protein